MIPGLLFLIQQDRYLFVVAALVRIQRAESNTENNFLRITSSQTVKRAENPDDHFREQLQMSV